MAMNQLWQFSFWFDTRPLPFEPTARWAVVGMFTAAIVFAFACIYFKKIKDGSLSWKIWSKWFNWSLSFGIVGLILTFLKQERIAYLGMRIWLIILLASYLIWLGFILKYLVLEVPRIKEEKRRKEELKKYLP